MATSVAYRVTRPAMMDAYSPGASSQTNCPASTIVSLLLRSAQRIPKVGWATHI
jgi:hypothetical protein